MSWTSISDLRQQLQRHWDRGDLLRAVVGYGPDWPWRLTLRRPTAADLTHRFEAVRQWIEALQQAAPVRLQWQLRNHRVLGSQRLPTEAWVDDPKAVIGWLGQRSAASRFLQTWQQTSAQQPELLQWLARQPLQALALADRWPRILAVVDWVRRHPRPGVYLRQLDVPGVDTKFVEQHRGVLGECLDCVLAAEQIDAQASGSMGFARRYGFLDKPARIRLRLLDARLPSLPGCQGLTDIKLDARSFATLQWPVEHVYIVENEVNFLAFPQCPASIAIFGAGYGWESIAAAEWLNQCPIVYWGDIDTHGLAILDQLRRNLPQARSLLMDHETLHQHRLHWGEEPTPTRQDLPRLTAPEAALYDDLRFDRIQARLRLEQERVSFGYFLARLAAIQTTL